MQNSSTSDKNAKAASTRENANNSELLGFIESVAGDTHVRVEENLGDGYVRLRSSEAERRQAKHDIRSVEDIVIELLRNSRDAGATSIFLATTKESSMRSIVVLDNGCGIPEHMQELVFEPRVTSKLDTMTMDKWGVHGRGMALFSIKENVSKVKVASSFDGGGTAIYVLVDTDVLGEKTDQSSVPSLERGEDGNLYVARGPHNINRKVLEFAIESRHEVDVYLGSPAEIAATLIEYGEKVSDDKDLLFNDDVSSLPVCQRLAASGSALELMQRCTSMGLQISERTAHRVLHGQVAPLRPYFEMVSKTKSKTSAKKEVNIFKDSRALKISKEDLGSFSRKLETAFDSIAMQYYLSLKDEPKITVGKDAIRVVFPIEKE